MARRDTYRHRFIDRLYQKNSGNRSYKLLNFELRDLTYLTFLFLRLCVNSCQRIYRKFTLDSLRSKFFDYQEETIVLDILSFVLSLGIFSLFLSFSLDLPLVLFNLTFSPQIFPLLMSTSKSPYANISNFFLGRCLQLLMSLESCRERGESIIL